MKIYYQIKEWLKPYYLPFIHRYKFKKQNKALNTHGNDVLLRAKEALESINIHFWLDFGTLLGVYRDGRLISHDFDIDIAVFLNDYSPKIEEVMQKYGFKYERKLVVDDGKYALEQGFSYQNVGLDIFYYSLNNDQVAYCHLFPLNEDKEFIIRELYTTYTGFKKVHFLNTEFNIPKDTNLRLTETYGEDYRIPVTNWYTPDDALNSKIITNKVCNEIKFN